MVVWTFLGKSLYLHLFNGAHALFPGNSTSMASWIIADQETHWLSQSYCEKWTTGSLVSDTSEKPPLP